MAGPAWTTRIRRPPKEPPTPTSVPPDALPGIAGLFTYRDLHHNLFGAIIQDEFLLAEEVVSFIGHPIVVIAAESRAAIRAAKAAIKIDIEELEPVFTIDEAKKRSLFIGKTMTIQRGDVASAFASAKNILEGTFVNGGQDHFYLEGHIAVALPQEDGAMLVHSSTQHPTEVQQMIERGLPGAHVEVQDTTGGGDHFQVIVTSPRFDGLPLLDQHRLVNEALAEPLRDGTIHELRIKTRGTT